MVAVVQAQKSQGGHDDYVYPDDSPPPVVVQSSTPTIDIAAIRAAYIQASDEICQGASVEIAKIADQPDTTVKLQKQLSIIESMLFQWEALRPPPGDELQIGGIFDIHDRQVGYQRDALNALRRNDRVSADQLLERSQALIDEANRQKRTYGFRVC